MYIYTYVGTYLSICRSIRLSVYLLTHAHVRMYACRHALHFSGHGFGPPWFGKMTWAISNFSKRWKNSCEVSRTGTRVWGLRFGV